MTVCKPIEPTHGVCQINRMVDSTQQNQSCGTDISLFVYFGQTLPFVLYEQVH